MLHFSRCFCHTFRSDLDKGGGLLLKNVVLQFRFAGGIVANYRAILLVLLLSLMPASNAAVNQRPHIIVRKGEYSELSSRSHKWPWNVMAEKAVETARTISYCETSSYNQLCYSTIPELAGACALAYILDPENRDFYRAKVENDLHQAIHRVRIERDRLTGHASSVSPANAAFMLYIVLDIMYDAMDPGIRESMESDCDYLAVHHEHSWESSEYSIKAMKELYHNGKSAAFDSLKNLYKARILDITSEDGVYCTGPGYAHSRLFWNERIQKKIFMDVCEYQGYHEFYSNPKLINLHEWFFGYAFSPFNRTYTFGDSPPIKTLDNWSLAALRSGNFSGKAQGYAAHFIGPLQDSDLRGNILDFILLKQLPAGAQIPGSRIFPSGGAWLLESVDSPDALAGVLWNTSSIDSSHTHFDANSINIAAYGEFVLRNSGYDGWGNPNPELWRWIRRTAQSSNTVQIDGLNHSTFKGGGIRHWLLGERVEYATGFSGKALPNGSHDRTLFFVKPGVGHNGYFALHDVIQAENPSALVSVVLHPNSEAEPYWVHEKEEYRFDVTGCNFSGSPVQVSLFLVTEPEQVELNRGYLGSYYECSRFWGRYLYFSYSTDSTGGRDILTVIFPSDSDHPMANMDRDRVNGVDVAIVEHDKSCKDFFIGRSPSAVEYEGVNFSGESCFFRKENGTVSSFLVRNSGRFVFDNSFFGGFSAESSISAEFVGNRGIIKSRGTRITVHGDVDKVKINDLAVPIIKTNENEWTFQCPPGRHKITVVSRSRE